VSVKQGSLFTESLETGKKTCTSCGETKPVAQFSRNPKTRDHLSSWCRGCHRQSIRLAALRREGMSKEEIRADIAAAEKVRHQRWLDKGSEAAKRNLARGRLDPAVKAARSLERAKAREQRKAEKRNNGDYRLKLRCKTRGITQSEFWGMWYMQDGQCAICGIPLELERKGNESQRASSVIDHEHETGVVRCILCSPCNVYIGMVRTTPHQMIAGVAPAHTLRTCRQMWSRVG
jgi:hypothetical protein